MRDHAAVFDARRALRGHQQDRAADTETRPRERRTLTPAEAQQVAAAEAGLLVADHEVDEAGPGPLGLGGRVAPSTLASLLRDGPALEIEQAGEAGEVVRRVQRGMEDGSVCGPARQRITTEGKGAAGQWT